MPSYLKILPVFCFCSLAAVAQRADLFKADPQLETGNFYHRNYTSKEYDASFQNWESVQDDHGVLYFANGDGVLSFDGKTWTLIETPTKSVIRSLAVDALGKIYVGALDDLGFLEKGSNGKLNYRSLLSDIDEDKRLMGNIWNIHCEDGNIYFEAETGMFLWDGKQFKFWPWPDAQPYHKSFFWNDQLFLYQEGTGLMKFSDGKFALTPGGDFFKSKRIYTVIARNNHIVLGTKFDGLFHFDGNRVMPFQTEADAYFKENQIYSAIELSDQTFMIGTRTGGALAIDYSGKIQYMITKKTGLPSNTVWGIAMDSHGDLWFSLDDGISMFEINNNLNTYLTGLGLEGAPNDLIRQSGRIYVASSIGLFELNPAKFPSSTAHFEKIEAINATCWSLVNINNKLLVGTGQGLFEVDGKKVTRLTDHPSTSIHRFKGDPERIIVGIDNRLQSLRLRNDRWIEAGYIDDVAADNVKFIETHEGNVWISTFSQGVFLLSFVQKDGTISYDHPSVTHFGTQDGLEEGYIKINSIDGEELFRIGTGSKLFRFDKTANRFFHDSTFYRKHGLSDKNIFPITSEDESGTFWVKTRRRADGSQDCFVVTPGSSSYEVKPVDVSRIFESVGLVTYPEDDGYVWYAASGGVVRQKFKEEPKIDSLFDTYIHKIIINRDSIFLDGIGVTHSLVEIPYSFNSLRFEFTSNNFVAGDVNQFQYKLEGYDDDWSEWSGENIKEYSRIWEGDYTFFVRSRNFKGVVGRTDAFHFTIHPPWFRSLYAYAFYILTAAVAIWILMRWRSYQLQQEKEELKKVIASRTEEIMAQNVQLAEQSEELRVNAEQLKELDTLKSNFFVNISHEFRTPLSLIISPLEKSLAERENGNLRPSDIERMHRNAKRLQQLINQLLDLAKLESGGMKVNPERTDLIYFLRVITASFESLAESRNIVFDVSLPLNYFEALIDRDKLETILYNLLSNAFKFTPDGGKINVQFLAGNESIQITITDSGHGIPADELNKIFDRFYQVDGSSSREYEGTGIGLSLVKELVNLMNGNIVVTSEVNKGSSFKIDLPVVKVESSQAGEQFNDLFASDYSVENNLESSGFVKDEASVSESLVLIIEDNVDLRNYLRENLENEYTIALAQNGKEGLEKALELVPDLIISDMMMPMMDGLTLCKKIRGDERISHIPFILLTARATIEDKLEGLELGADDYMTKPFQVKEVRVRVKNLLEQREILRKSFGREVTVQPKKIAITSVDEKFLNHALQIMEAHVADDQFSVEKFAEEIGMSRKNLLRKIKALTNESVNEFIRNFRLRRAADLLAGRAGTVSEVAYKVGFNNLSYFSKCFRELFGVLPADFADKRSIPD